MKELELLGEILAGQKVTFIFGDGGMAGQLRKLVPEDANA